VKYVILLTPKIGNPGKKFAKMTIEDVFGQLGGVNFNYLCRDFQVTNAFLAAVPIRFFKTRSL
jgi:hypothetical protein